LEECVLAYVKALWDEEHKKKLVKDARLVDLADKTSEEIHEDVVLESLKTLSTEEVQRQSSEKDTMMHIDGELVLEVVIVESILA